MRVNPDYTQDILAAISKTQQDQQTALQQISTGRRVSSPSDDPASAAAYVLNRASVSRNDAYLQTVTALKAQMNTADSTLASVVTLLNRAISLGTAGGTDPLTPDNRTAIANNVQGVLDGVLQLANTAYQGSYLFGGTNTSQAPFSATYTYNGSSDANKVAVGDGRNVETGVPGDKLFKDSKVFDSLKNLVDKLTTGTDTEIQAATADVNKALNALSSARTTYGNTLDQLDSVQSFLNGNKVTLSSEENDLVGVDITKAVSDLTQAILANGAALSAFAKASRETLLDYLR
jgi:flagellar hook-associated protein 3 FlgL